MIASAPGKVILFGEHAVVYGRHAVVTAINRRCYADVKKSSEIRIRSSIATTELDFDKHPYVSFAIKRFMSFSPISGVEIKIRSKIPVSSGLGSSAAVTVSVLKALDAEFEAGLTNEDIYEIARKVELDVQGRASGTDPFISTYGGSWLIPERKKIGVDNLRILIIDSQQSSVTSEMVSKVAKLRERYPEIIEDIFDAIDSISLRSIDSLEKKDFSKISDMVFINQCLLRSISISNERIDELISRLSRDGITAKITGAGGGGCLIGFGSDEAIASVLDNYPAFAVEPELEGVKIEH
jgi:mevalonate kinase